jgi:uncharacterized membrane protein
VEAKEEILVTNLKPSMASALCYAPFVGWVAAIVLFLVEKNKEVRWNAVQAIILGLAFLVVSAALSVTIILAVFVPVVWIVMLVLNLWLTMKVYQGSKVRLPLVAEWTDKVLKKMQA